MARLNVDPNVQLNISASVIELPEEKRFANNETRTRRKKYGESRKNISQSVINLPKEPIAGVSGTQKLPAKTQCKRGLFSDSASSLVVLLFSEDGIKKAKLGNVYKLLNQLQGNFLSSGIRALHLSIPNTTTTCYFFYNLVLGQGR